MVYCVILFLILVAEKLICVAIFCIIFARYFVSQYFSVNFYRCSVLALFFFSFFFWHVTWLKQAVVKPLATKPKMFLRKYSFKNIQAAVKRSSPVICLLDDVIFKDKKIFICVFGWLYRNNSKCSSAYGRMNLGTTDNYLATNTFHLDGFT